MQPLPWTLTFIETFPFGYKITDATGEVVVQASAACHSTKQKNLEDNRNGVGFKWDGEWSREEAMRLVAQQEATAELIVRSVNESAALRQQRDELLAALKKITYERDGRFFIGMHADADVTDEVGAAIAKAGALPLERTEPWRLFVCCQETGKEGLLDEGDQDSMARALKFHADQGSDVWLISPNGTKVLP